jgi:hypothetical protein
MVELLTAYSHSTQAADLRLCYTVALTNPVCRPETERGIAELITEVAHVTTPADDHAEQRQRQASLLLS